MGIGLRTRAVRTCRMVTVFLFTVDVLRPTAKIIRFTANDLRPAEENLR